MYNSIAALDFIFKISAEKVHVRDYYYSFCPRVYNNMGCALGHLKSQYLFHIKIPDITSCP